MNTNINNKRILKSSVVKSGKDSLSKQNYVQDLREDKKYTHLTLMSTGGEFKDKLLPSLLKFKTPDCKVHRILTEESSVSKGGSDIK